MAARANRWVPMTDRSSRRTRAPFWRAMSTVRRMPARTAHAPRRSGEHAQKVGWRADNVQAAIEFLVRAFGFTRRRLETTPAGAIARAELRFACGALCVRSALAATGPWAGIRHAIHVATTSMRDLTTRDPGGFFWSFGPD